MGLGDVPLELIEAVLDSIDSPDDVLAFALTSRYIVPLAPRHIHLRIIRCSKRALCVWSLLASDISLARNVRVLDIDSAVHDDRIPRAFLNPHPACRHCHPDSHEPPGERSAARDVERMLLAGALQNTDNLRTFKHRNASPNGNDGRRMWKAVAACPNISELSIDGNGHNYIWKSAIFTMSNLTSFEYYTSFAWAGEPFDPRRVGRMLRERCPNLQTLALSVGHNALLNCPAADISTPILSGRWPALASLTLHSAACTVPALIAFLAAHPTLRFLDIDSLVGFAGPLAHPPGLLPRLERLTSTAQHVVDILASPCETPRPLRQVLVKDALSGGVAGVELRTVLESLEGVEMYPKDWSTLIDQRM